MKKIFFSILFIFLFSVAASAATSVYEFNDAVNPTAGQILINTGAIYEGGSAGTTCKVFVQAYSSVNATVGFRIKNASGVVVKTYKFIIPANNRGLFGDPSLQFDVQNNYSLEVAAPAAITGTLHGAIFVEPIVTY